ncbi:MAG: toprim domain-containing protein [Candidatus Bathyarchaeota archaeon]|nr:MAG: toprim domain-containing protein [Candidatus Bathyarchaeota archaeon]
MKRKRKKIKNPDELREALEDFLRELEYLADVVVVEGQRDAEALRNLGFRGKIEGLSRVGVPDSDLVESIARENSSVVILTDFDEEGRRINGHLSRLFERRGLKVERGLRREAGRLMASIGVYAIEALDSSIVG